MAFSKTSVVGLALASGLFLSGCERQNQGASGMTTETPAAPATPVPTVAAKTTTLPTTVEGGSPHFSKVLGRLDVGGKMLQFQDNEGSREMLVEIIKLLSSSIPEAREMTTKVDPGTLVDLSGLADVAASGRSVTKDGDAWLTRTYDYLPAGPKGLRELLGTEAFAFESPTLVPAATDLVVETRLDATFLPGFVTRVCEAAGAPAKAGEMLQEKLPNGESVADLMAKTRLHVVLGVDVSSWPENPKIPRPVDYFLRISGGGDLLAMLRPELEKSFGPPAALGNRKGWELPMPALGVQTRGVLAFEDSGTVLLASRGEYLKFVDTAAMKLGAWKEYQEATNHFPAKGNLLAYASPQVPAVLGWLIGQAARSSSEPSAELIATAASSLPARALSFCIAHEKDGIATTSETPFSADMNMTSTLPLLTGTSVLFVGARAWKKGSDRAACIINTRNIQQAVRSYQNMNDVKTGTPIPWDKIVGPGAFIENPPSCSGGTYTFATTIPKTGTLACTCSNPDHKVADHSDW